MAFHLADDPPISSATTLREMRAPAYLAPGWAWAQAIGWRLEPYDGRTVVSHAGTTAHYRDGTAGQWRAHLAVVPDVEVGVVVLTNCNRDPAAFCQMVTDLVIPAADLMQRRQRAEAGQAHSWCAGSYRCADGIFWLNAKVDIDGAALAVDVTGNTTEEWKLRPLDDERFRITTGLLAGEEATFERSTEARPASGFYVGRFVFSRVE